MKTYQKNLLKVKKIKDIINLILAMFITLTPVITIFLNIIGVSVRIHQLFQAFGWMYMIFLPLVIVYFFMHKNFLALLLEKIKKLPIILAISLYTLMMISCIATDTFNVFLLYFIVYLFIFISVITLDEKYEGLLVNTLIVTITFVSLLGIIDPTQKFIPGFDTDSYPLSMVFYNPNYSGYLIGMLAILNVWMLATTQDKKQKIISVIAYIVFNINIFMNGSFAPITFMILSIFCMVLFLWIKNRRCPTKVLTLLLCIIPFIFLVDLIPNINDYRTCDYNYFLECIAVLDNMLGTKMLRMFGISSITGADGWNRDELQAKAMAEIFGSAKTFIFGNGAGGNFEFTPHNSFICLWLNFGLLPTLIYYAINIYLVVRFFQLKKNTHLIGYISANVGYLLMLMTGDLIEYSFCFHMILLAITFRKVEKGHREQKKEIQEAHIKAYLEEQEKLKAEKMAKTNKRKSSTSKSTTKSTAKKDTTTAKKSSTSTTKIKAIKNKDIKNETSEQQVILEQTEDVQI